MSFNLDVDTTGLVEGRSQLTSFGTEYGKMVTRMVTDMKRMERASKANEVVQKAAREATVGKLAQQDLSAWLKLTNQRIQMMKRSQNASELQAKTEQTNRAREQADIASLTAKYNPLAAAASKYERIRKEIIRSQELGIITTQQQKRALEQLKLEYSSLQAGVVLAGSRFNQFGEISTIAGKRMNKMNMYAQQAGYQFADFAVQIQGGTNALVALGQQGSQLLGIFGAAGAIAGAVLAIGTAIALPLVRMNQGAKDFDNALKGARDSTIELRKELELINSGLADAEQLTLRKQVDESRKRVKEAQETLNQITSNINSTDTGVGNQQEAALQRRRIEAAQETLRLAKEEFDERQNLLDTTGRLESLQTMMNYSLEQARVAQTERVALEREGEAIAKELLSNLTDQTVLQSTIARYGEDSRQVALLRVDAERRAFEELVNSLAVGKDLKNELMAAWQNANGLASVDMASGIAAAAGSAAYLAQMLGISVNLANSLALQETPSGPKLGFGSGVGGAGDPSVGSERLGFGKFGEGPRKNVVDLSGLTSKGSGGGSGGSGGSGGGSSSPDAVQELKEEMRLRGELLFVFGKERLLREEIQDIEKSLGDDRSKYSTSFIQGLAQQNLALKEQEEIYDQLVERQQQVFDTIESSMSNSIMSVVSGTQSISDAFSDMARNIILELTEVLFVQRLVGSFDVSSGKGSGIVGFLSSSLLSFDGGGSTGSGSRSGGLDGKGGFMAMLHPQETVVDHTKGQNIQQGTQQIELILHAAEGVTIETVRNEAGAIINSAAPKIVSASVSASQKSMKSSKNPWGL